MRSDLLGRVERDALRWLCEAGLRRLHRVARQAAFLHHALHARERHAAARWVGDLRRDRDRDSGKERDGRGGQCPLRVAAMAEHEELPDQHAGRHDDGEQAHTAPGSDRRSFQGRLRSPGLHRRRGVLLHRHYTQRQNLNYPERPGVDSAAGARRTSLGDGGRIYLCRG